MSSATKNLYFVRHGERIDFIDSTWSSTAERPSDPPLSPDGYEQAAELGSYIAKLRPRVTHIYASPFLRTIQTALAIASRLNESVSSPEQFVRIRLEPGFGEYYVNNHVWNDKTIFQSAHAISEVSENKKQFDLGYHSLLDADYYLQLKVESRQQLRDRLKQLLQHLLDTHRDDCNILIVTHAATLIEGVRALLTLGKEQHQLAWDMSPIRAGLCSLSHFELLDNRWNLATSGLTAYLSKGEKHAWIFPDDAALYETTVASDQA